MTDLPEVVIYTDGACEPNPGSGGWCALLMYKNQRKVLSGNAANTTNNKMELTAVIEALRALKRKCDVRINSDSQYVCKAFNDGWLSSWKRNGRMKLNSQDSVANVNLWIELDRLVQQHEVSFQWVKGHSGDPFNEYCDKVAVMEIHKIQS